MRTWGCLLLLGAVAHAADLAAIERKIAKEPKYGSERQFYALLVLGPEAKTRIWFVVDGTHLFVDANGNGDLTEPGERFEVASSGNQEDFIPLSREWRIPELAERYSDVEVSIAFVNPKWRPAPDASNRAHMERFMRAVAVTPHANLTSIRVTIDGKRQQFGHAMLTTAAATAPLFHIDAPLTVGVIETILPFRFERGEKPENLRVAVGTPGHGPAQPGCFSYLMYRELPEAARPVVEVEFPAAGGGFLPPRRFALDDKC